VVQNALPGYDSPEEAFHAYVRGNVSQNFDQMLSALTPESKAYHVGLAVISVGYLFDKNAGEKLLRCHAAAFEKEAKLEGESDDMFLVRVVGAVTDPGGLMKAIVQREEELAKQFADVTTTPDNRKQPTMDRLIESINLKNTKVSGSMAVADVEYTKPAKDYLANEATALKTVKFRQIDNRWYCSIDPR
jgi:hypothetical protein